MGFQDHVVALFSLEFFCKKNLSLLPYSFTHLFNLLFISIQTHIFTFFFGLSIQTMLLILLLEIFLSAIGDSFRLVPVFL